MGKGPDGREGATTNAPFRDGTGSTSRQPVDIERVQGTTALDLPCNRSSRLTSLTPCPNPSFPSTSESLRDRALVIICEVPGRCSPQGPTGSASASGSCMSSRTAGGDPDKPPAGSSKTKEGSSLESPTNFLAPATEDSNPSTTNRGFCSGPRGAAEQGSVWSCSSGFDGATVRGVPGESGSSAASVTAAADAFGESEQQEGSPGWPGGGVIIPLMSVSPSGCC